MSDQPIPTGPFSKRTLIAVGLMVLAIACQQFLHIPWKNHFTNTLTNWLHVPLFFLLTAFVMWVKPTFSRIRVAAIVGIIAVATEILQFFTGRQASISDLTLDAIGCALALFTLAPMTCKRWFWAGLFCLMVTAAAPGYVLIGYAYQNMLFPVLYEPAGFGATSFIEVRGETKLTKGHPWSRYKNQQVLEVQWQQTRWPGIHLLEPVGHWQSYQTLVVDVYNLQATQQPLTAGVRHARHGGTSRYLQRSLEPGDNQIRYPLTELAHLDDGSPADIYHLILYTTEKYSGQQILLGRVWLE